jgi:hypothetical protein
MFGKEKYGEWNFIDAVDFDVPAATRTNLGLGASWLVNTNSPVFVGTNGEVVSPTNFWQVSPLNTVVQNFTPSINSTNPATNARSLYVFSMAPSTVGITNTITLPTNTNTTLVGDVATVTHLATNSSSVTGVRQLGAATNLVSLNSFKQTVNFVYQTNGWTDVGATTTKEALGLGANNTVNFDGVNVSQDFRVTDGTNNFAVIAFDEAFFDVGVAIASSLGLTFSGTNAATAAAATRTNLGLYATNEASVFLAERLFDAANGVWGFYVSDEMWYTQPAFVNTNAPTNTTNAVRWIDIAVGTNFYKIPLYQ